MRVTLDHNCLIDVANATDLGRQVLAVSESPEYECYIVNIGASEILKRGVRPNNYATFDAFLTEIEWMQLPSEFESRNIFWPNLL